VAKVNGIPTVFSIDNTAGTPVDISALVGNCTINTSRALQDVTGLDKDGTERITLRGDYSIDVAGFEDDANTIDPIFLDPANLRSLAITLNGRSFASEGVIASFVETRGPDGSLGWTATIQQAGGESLGDLWT
jgi:hypothetical protein